MPTPLRITLAFLLFVAFLPLHANATQFSDVPDSYRYKSAILWLNQHNIANGYSDGTFRPSDPINRAEFVKIVLNATKQSETYAAPQTPCASSLNAVGFPDVHASDWFASYVCTASAIGFIQAYPDGTFNAGRLVSFAEAAKMVVIATGNTPSSVSTPWYQAYVDALRRTDPNHPPVFAPDHPGEGAIPASIHSMDQQVTRGEMAEILYRMYYDVAG